LETIDVEGGLGRWPGLAGARATLLNLSENHTFRVDTPAGPFVLRVHRPGYQSAASIASELEWLTALDGVLPVPRPLPGIDDLLLQAIVPDRSAVLFAFEPGSEPSETSDLAPLFATLGGYAATLHEHTERWTRGPRFTRPTWAAETMLGADGLWGDWRKAPHVAGSVRTALDGVDRRIRAELAAYGRPQGRFGLIHADMRLGNLLVDGERVTLIDFDDSGFGWHLYDLAASLSFIEMRRDLPALIDAWLAGYAARRPLDAEDQAVIPAMILLRRLVLLAWIGSHGETGLARRHASDFAVDTVTLAGRLWG
jgi:Ser/Thr protein kinase RdoA (MazF antagonist)